MVMERRLVMKTMISHCIDGHNMDSVIEYAKHYKSKIKAKELAEVIDIWGDRPSKDFKKKEDKYWEVIRILDKLQEMYHY